MPYLIMHNISIDSVTWKKFKHLSVFLNLEIERFRGGEATYKLVRFGSRLISGGIVPTRL